MRAGCLAACLLLVSRSLAAQDERRLFENSVRQISLLLARSLQMRLAILVLVEQSPGSPPAKDLVEAETTKLRTLVEESFAREEGFTLVFLGAGESLPGETGTASADEARLLDRCRGLGANYALLVKVESYRTGEGEISETVARFVELDGGSERARDVVWTVRSSSGVLSVFVNGVRIK